MGRYDRIRVYNGSGWQQPSRIRVFSNNAWQDLGENDSAITKSLNVLSGGAWRRATLNRETYTIPGESYAQGSFSLTPANGYCYCSNSNNSVNTTWYFRCTMRKTDNGEKQVFWTGNSAWSCYLQIVWLADGRVRVSIKSAYGSGSVQSITTSNAVGANQWVYLDVTCNKGVYKMTVNFNGVTTSGNMWETWQITNASNVVGSAGMQFKDGLACQGTKYSNGSSTMWADMNTASGNVGNVAGVSHVNTSSTGVRWV